MSKTFFKFILSIDTNINDTRVRIKGS